jgi:hypothetical protein
MCTLFLAIKLCINLSCSLACVCERIALTNYYVSFHLVTEHPWLQNAKKAPNVPLGDIVRARLKQFSVMNRFKKRALRVSISMCNYLLKF